jgi:hypothetical protein
MCVIPTSPQECYNKLFIIFFSLLFSAPCGHHQMKTQIDYFWNCYIALYFNRIQSVNILAVISLCFHMIIYASGRKMY